MIVSLGKEFGVPLRKDDFSDTTNSSLALTNGNKHESHSTLNVSPVSMTFKRRSEPLDMSNKAYEQLLEERRKGRIVETDHICANIVSS